MSYQQLCKHHSESKEQFLQQQRKALCRNKPQNYAVDVDCCKSSIFLQDFG